jgi:hypothetical protein
MPSRCYVGDDYFDALGFMKYYQKNRESIKTETYGPEMFLDGETIIIASPWQARLGYGEPMVEYFQDGTCQLYWNGSFKYAQWWKERVRRWTPAKAYTTKGKGFIIVPNQYTEDKWQKCRRCHGYVWQGMEIEKTLYQLAEMSGDGKQDNYLYGPPIWANGRDDYNAWDRVARFVSDEVYKHFAPCHQCSGTGKYNYGCKQLMVPFENGIIILPDGTPQVPSEA